MHNKDSSFLKDMIPRIIELLGLDKTKDTTKIMFNR